MEGEEFLKSQKKFIHKRVKTPTVIQMEVVECGAASLSIILSHYKRYVTLEELRVATGVSSDGVKASSIVKAAELYGLECKAFKKDIAHLIELPPPYIVFWNFNHFLVVEGFSKTGVYVNDPAAGPKKVSFRDFSQFYTGLVLTLKPTDKFEPGGKPPSVWKALKSRLTGISGVFLFLALAQFCLLIPGLASVAFTQVFLDGIFQAKRLDWRWYLINSMICSLLIHVILIWMRGRCLYRLNAKIAIKLSSEFFFHILKLPLSFYQQRSSGDLAYRLQMNDTVINTITGQLSRAFLNVVLIGVYFVMLLYFSPIIAMLGLFEAAVDIGILLWINRKRTDAMSRVMQTQLQMIGYSVTGLQNIETVKSLGLEGDFFTQWSNANTKWLISTQEFGHTNIVLNTMTPFFKAFTRVALIGIGAVLVMQGRLSVGQLMALQVIMHHFLGPLVELVGLGKTLQKTKVDLMRLDDSLNNKVDESFENEAESYDLDQDSLSKLQGYVEMKNVSFGYNPSIGPVVFDLNLSVKPGQSIAIVGTSDCGKSTIAYLLAGLYYPWSGEITYDNKPRKEHPPMIFHNSVAVVDQRIKIFEGTIRENITMWNDAVTDKMLVKASSDACIHNKIIDRIGGYEYRVKEGGIDFSGGERQRLEIARALVINPKTIILDEALSSLDAETESEIFRNIKHRGCSTIVMTNRLSTIMQCDMVVVLDRGEIVQTGTHETLKDQEGVYKEVILLSGDGNG